jgi:hypothetical protein
MIVQRGTVVIISGVDKVDKTYKVNTQKGIELEFSEDQLRRGTIPYQDPTDRFYERYDISE